MLPPWRAVFLALVALGIGLLPLYLRSSPPPAGPWYRTGSGWLCLLAMLWVAVTGLGAALLGAGLAIRTRSIFTLLVSLALGAAAVMIIRAYLRALF